MEPMPMPTLPARPLRSWLFVPGNKERFVVKALGDTEADAVLLDLEDGVPPHEKRAARVMVAEALAEPPGGPLRAVRVNARATGLLDADLEAIAGPGVDAICLSKVESPAEVREVADLTGAWLIPAVESAQGVLRAPEIAGCHPRVLGLMLGGEDLALDLGLGARREAEGSEMLYARSAVVLAAAAARRLAIDGVFTDLDDAPGLEADALRARRLGFAGKCAVHPGQLQVINRIFTPSDEELKHARRVVEAFDSAHEGVITVDGQMVDRPVVERARRLLGRAP